ncbi:acyltransferase domain-containing protein, partial [Frankia sp. AgKG'84/4]|uniref:acyltransferase domain-containing protein n=1 Tax=Frankia sp. AgKG'84/4 TaxID=573490 RepID=UPI00202A8ADB
MTDSPYQDYLYAYPHKTAYRPLSPRPRLREVWAGEDRRALSLYLHVPFCEMRCGFCNLFTRTGAAADLTGRYLDALDRQATAVAAALAPHLDWDLLDVLTEAPGAASLERVDVVQPVLFAVLVALARLWQHHGVAPKAVVGHSQGEIAAAHIAGALTLDDAARIVALRSLALTTIAAPGAMASINLPAEQLEGLLTPGLSVAAVNSPATTIVAGDEAELTALLAAVRERDVRTRLLPVTYASHSPHVEAIRDELLAALAPVRPQPASIPILSTVTADWIDPTTLTADYWYANLRQPVLFEPATRALLTAGHDLFIEISPHPGLTTALTETLDTATGLSGPVAIAETLRRDVGGPAKFHAALAEAWVRGAPVDWRVALDTRQSAAPAARAVG